MNASIPSLILALVWLLQGGKESQKGIEPEEGVEAEEAELPEDMVKRLAPPGEKEESEEEEAEEGEDFVLLDSVPSGYALFAVTENGNLQRWDVGQHIQQFSVHPLVDAAIGLCRSLDGKSLLYADRLSSIAVLDAATGETTRRISWTQAQPITRLAWDSEKGIVFGGTERSLVRFNPDVPGEEFSVDLASNLGPIALDPLHGLLVAGIDDAMMAVVGMEPFALIERIGGHESDVTALAFNGTAELLASGSAGGEVLVWLFEQRRVLRVVRVPGAAIESLAFDIRTDLLAVGTERGDLIVLEARSGRQFAALPTDSEEPIDAVAFCDTGLLASADHEHGLRLWHLLRFIDKDLLPDLVRRAKSGERSRDKGGEQPPSGPPQKRRAKEPGEKPPREKSGEAKEGDSNPP